MTRSVGIRVRLCCDRRGSMIGELSATLLLTSEEMQTGLGLGGSLSRCVLGGMGSRDSVTTGLTHYPCTLSGPEENSTAQWFSIMD